MASRLSVILKHINKGHVTTNKCSSKALIDNKDNKFRYTRNCSLLTQEQRQFYEDNGYLVVQNLIADHILDLCRDHFVEICNGVKPSGGMFVMEEPSLRKAGAQGEYLCYKIQDLLYDEIFSKYTTSPQLLDYVECFTGPNVTAIHSMLINKPPDAQDTSEHPLHQDLLYFPFRPADKIVGTWTAMETVDSENGCLVVVPGSHKLEKLFSHSTQSELGSYKTFYGINNIEEVKPVPLHMEKGDTVFLHPLLVHGSGSNLSKRFRKAISCHYAASECEIIDPKGTPHTDIARDIEEAAVKQYGLSEDFGTIMKIRCVVVRGSEGFTAL